MTTDAVQQNCQAIIETSSRAFKHLPALKELLPSHFLYATSANKAVRIAQQGLVGGTNLVATKELACYHLGKAADDGADTLLLAIDASMLDLSKMQPDRSAIDAPITSAIGRTEGHVHTRWLESEKDWKASLEIVQSVLYVADIPTTAIQIVDREGAFLPLATLI